MANKNFNKQVVPARTKLAIGGPATKKEITHDLSSGTKEMRGRKNERLKRFNDKRSPSDMISIPVSEKKGRNTFKASIKKVVKGGKEHQNYMEKEKNNGMEERMKKVGVNKTQKGGRKRTKSMMDRTRAKSLGLK